MTVIGVILKPALDSALEVARSLEQWCEEKEFSLLFEEASAELLGGREGAVSKEELVQRADPIVVFGGDGTLIGAARHAGEKSPLFLGVNFGNLGFLTELTPDQLLPKLDKVIKGTVTGVSRSLLHASVYRKEERVFESQAVNDVVIQKGTRSRLLELDVFINSRDLMRIRGDGLIFSTPTGSTAYSLAAGGSIAYPSLDVTLLTPICPHSLTYRPLILPATANASVEIPSYDDEVYVTIDGQASCSLSPGDTVRVRQAKTKIRFVRSPREDYFSILRKKLNWGIPNESE